MNAALGGVSAGGRGTPLFEVTHTGGGPSALVANQSVGNAGGVTLSKFSFNVTRPEHGGHGLPPESCAIGATATPAAMSKSNKTMSRSRVSVRICFKFSTMLPMRDQFYGRGRIVSMLMRRSWLREEKSAMSELL
jgi:hypothetical protein